MPTMPWTRLLKEDTAPSDALAMLTYLSLKHWWHTPSFVMYIVRIHAQLRRTPGLIGFSMRAKPFAKQYWTLSLWQDKQSIATYVQTPPHAIIMHEMGGKMGQTAFVSWSVSDPSTPLEWSDALARSTNSY